MLNLFAFIFKVISSYLSIQYCAKQTIDISVQTITNVLLSSLGYLLDKPHFSKWVPVPSINSSLFILTDLTCAYFWPTVNKGPIPSLTRVFFDLSQWAFFDPKVKKRKNLGFSAEIPKSDVADPGPSVQHLGVIEASEWRSLEIFLWSLI